MFASSATFKICIPSNVQVQFVTGICVHEPRLFEYDRCYKGSFQQSMLLILLLFGSEKMESLSSIACMQTLSLQLCVGMWVSVDSCTSCKCFARPLVLSLIPVLCAQIIRYGGHPLVKKSISSLILTHLTALVAIRVKNVCVNVVYAL